MQCPNCGSELKSGNLFCEICGQEVQIVPDYDPLDELFIGQDRSEETKQKEKLNKLEEKPKKQEPQVGKRFRFPVKGVLMLVGLLICFGVFLASYYSISQESNYSYQLKRGISLVEKENYEAALPFLKRARELQSNTEGADPKPLRYLAQAYAHTNAGELAEECMKNAIRMEDDNPDLYMELMEILNLTGRTEEIDGIIENCKNKEIRALLLPYRIEKPSSNLPEDTYSHYLKLELKAKYGTIYYTLDGTAPTQESTRYERPIELLEEGETLLSAVAVNKMGIASDELVLVYRLEFDKNNVVEDEEE